MGWPAIGMVRDAIEGAVRCQGLLPEYTGTPIISGIEVRSPLYNTSSGPGNQALGIFESFLNIFLCARHTNYEGSVSQPWKFFIGANTANDRQ